MGQSGNNFSIRNNWVVDTGLYGIFPEFGHNGLIENNILSEIEDAAASSISLSMLFSINPL